MFIRTGVSKLLRVRDCDPLGRRLAIDSSTPFHFAQNDTSQGFVARATRACRWCARGALQYSPTRIYAGNAQKKNMNIADLENDLLFLLIQLKSAKTSAPCALNFEIVYSWYR